MTRWISAIAALVASVCFAGASAEAQVYYGYGSPVYAPVYAYPAPVVLAPSPVITSAYAYPAPIAYSAPVAYSAAYAPQPIVQMGYSAPAYVAPAYVAAPMVVGPGPVRTTIRGGPFNYTETVRAYGPTVGPHYARVHVHQGLFGTTVRERIR